jgi:uncharacterized integral membrane protein
MKIFYLILVILFAFFIVTFSQFNAEPVRIKYFNFVDTPVPGYMLIFAALLIGVIITWFLGAVERFRLSRTISKQNKTIRDLRKELRASDAPPMIEEKKKSV